MTCLRELHKHRRPVPADVQVVGSEDLPLAAQTTPLLTTIRQDIRKGAKATVRSLMARIDGEDAPRPVMPPRLVVRDTARASH